MGRKGSWLDRVDLEQGVRNLNKEFSVDCHRTRGDGWRTSTFWANVATS